MVQQLVVVASCGVGAPARTGDGRVRDVPRRFVVETRRAHAPVGDGARAGERPWNPWWAPPVIAVYVVAANGPCIVVHRYNRARLRRFVQRACLKSPAVTTQEPGTGPLDGVRVLELGSFIAGPFAGQLLGDLGADVVKVEPPGTGDPMRQWGVCVDGRSLWWPAIARNKRSVALDLRDDAARRAVRRIAGTCDVVLENFRPGQLATWGMVVRRRSRATTASVIVVHVSGFGQTGPRVAEPGFGSIAEAVGGIRHTTGEADGPPARAGISLGDALAALFAVIGTLSALHERSRSGRGQEVDVAIYEAVFALMESTVADYEVGGVVRGRSGGYLPGVAPSNSYPTRDGRDVVIAANADAVFTRLADAMGQPQLATDARYATHRRAGARQEELDALVARWTATFDADTLVEHLRGYAIPVGVASTAPGPRDRPARRGARHDPPPRRRLRAAGPDGWRRAEAVAHAGNGPQRGPRRSASTPPRCCARRASPTPRSPPWASPPNAAVAPETANLAVSGANQVVRGEWHGRETGHDARKNLGSAGASSSGSTATRSASASVTSASVNSTVVVQNSTITPFGSVAYTEWHQPWSISATSMPWSSQRRLRASRSARSEAANARWLAQIGKPSAVEIAVP